MNEETPPEPVPEAIEETRRNPPADPPPAARSYQLARTIAVFLIIVSLLLPWASAEGGGTENGWTIAAQATASAVGIIVRPFLFLLVAAIAALFRHENRIIRWAYRILLIFWFALIISMLFGDPADRGALLWGAWIFAAGILLALAVEIASFYRLEDRRL